MHHLSQTLELPSSFGTRIVGFQGQVGRLIASKLLIPALKEATLNDFEVFQ